VLRANHAVRLGLRAATRNPELAFAKALIDQAGTLLALLPILLFAIALAGLSAADPIQLALRAAEAVQRVRWPLAGAAAAAGLVGWTLGAAFWSGALPLLAADAELGRRPPSGNFFLLVARGVARIVPAAIVTWLLTVLSAAALIASFASAFVGLVHRPPALIVALALLATLAIAGGVAVDLLARLTLVRAAVFSDGPATAVARAASLLGQRLGACYALTAAFLLLELVVASAAAAIGGIFAGTLLDPGVELISIGPRIALGLVTGVVLSWIEVARFGALAALAADAEGLIDEPAPPEPPPPPARVVEAIPAAELVVEALPIPPGEPPKQD
jgi:hypothetical protein